METNSFDNQIKEQLEQRTLEPSAKSWEQLRSKLDKKDKKTIHMFWWFGVAASFAGAILLASIIFNKVTTSPQIQVTENGTKIILEKEELLIIPELTLISESTTNQKLIVEENIKPKKVTQSVLEITPELVVQSTVYREASEEIIQPIKIDEAIAETVEIIKNSNITDEEIDALLDQALAEIRVKQTQNNKSISANQLLEEVEYEVERSFRERVFELLKDGFNISKDALANRNQ
jgi:hypothetical protein